MKSINKITTLLISAAFSTTAIAASLADAQKAYVAGNWKQAATAYEQVCPNQPADAQTECFLWNVLALSQTGNANDFAKAGKRLDSLIQKTNPQKKVYADLVMTRAQFQLYLGKFDNAADALVHAIETSQPEHAVVLKKVCTAIQAKVTKDNLTAACARVSSGNAPKTEQTNTQNVVQNATQLPVQDASAKEQPTSKQVPSTAKPQALDLPDFDSDLPSASPASESKAAVPAVAVQASQGETWVLQLGAFSMKPNAETLVNNLRKRKIQCNIVELLQDSRTLYIVQTTGFDTKEKAMDYGDKELSPLKVEFRPILKK